MTRDLQNLVASKAQLCIRLPERSLVAHDKECWAEAMYDARRVKCPVEIWRLGQGYRQQALINSCSFRLDLEK